VTLVVLAHGSANPAGARVVEAVAERVRYRLPGVPVRVAYVEVARPSLAEVLAEVTGEAVVVPLACAQGYAATATPRAAGTLVATSFGPERLLAGVMAERLRAAGARAGQPVVLVTAGSSDPTGQGHAAQTAQLLARVWSGPVRPAHLLGQGSRISEVVADLAARGLPRPAVVPYLVAPGQLLDRTRSAARSLGLDVLADVLGDHPHVAEAVARRYRVATARRFALSLR
jgi:sirohydrochlorin ferrochelatase